MLQFCLKLSIKGSNSTFSSNCYTAAYICCKVPHVVRAWLHFIIGITLVEEDSYSYNFATVYVIYIDCICWRWCRICCTLLVVVIPGRGSIWENWKITRACVVWINVCWGNKLKHNIKSHNLEFFQSVYSDTLNGLYHFQKLKKIFMTMLLLIRY